MDEQYWRKFRARARKRASCQGMLLLGPFGILVAVLKILEPMGYPPGDIRNSIEFRLAFYGLVIGLFLALMVHAARWLRADRR